MNSIKLESLRMHVVQPGNFKLGGFGLIDKCHCDEKCPKSWISFEDPFAKIVY